MRLLLLFHVFHTNAPHRLTSENTNVFNSFQPACPSLVSAGESSRTSSEWSQSHSYPATPSLSPVPEFLEVPDFGAYLLMGNAMDFEEENVMLPPVAGPSTVRDEHSPEPVQQVRMVEPNDEGTAGNPQSEAPSPLTFRCPLRRKRRRCGHMLVNDEDLILEHVREHKNAGELLRNIKSCRLCKEFPKHAHAPGRRAQAKQDKGNEPSLQSVARHIFTIHFGGLPFMCQHCGKTYSRKDALVRHLKKIGEQE